MSAEKDGSPLSDSFFIGKYRDERVKSSQKRQEKDGTERHETKRSFLRDGTPESNMQEPSVEL